MRNYRQLFKRILLLIDAHLQPELPVLLEDPIYLILQRAVPFVFWGILASAVVISCPPNGWPFLRGWASTLFLLPNWVQVLVYLILTLLIVVFFSYSAGVFLVFLFRFSFRLLLHRRRIPGHSIFKAPESAGLSQ